MTSSSSADCGQGTQLPDVGNTSSGYWHSSKRQYESTNQTALIRLRCHSQLPLPTIKLHRSTDGSAFTLLPYLAPDALKENTTSELTFGMGDLLSKVEAVAKHGLAGKNWQHVPDNPTALSKAARLKLLTSFMSLCTEANDKAAEHASNAKKKWIRLGQLTECQSITIKRSTLQDTSEQFVASTRTAERIFGFKQLVGKELTKLTDPISLKGSAQRTPHALSQMMTHHHPLGVISWVDNTWLRKSGDSKLYVRLDLKVHDPQTGFRIIRTAQDGLLGMDDTAGVEELDLADLLDVQWAEACKYPVLTAFLDATERQLEWLSTGTEQRSKKKLQHKPTEADRTTEVLRKGTCNSLHKHVKAIANELTLHAHQQTEFRSTVTQYLQNRGFVLSFSDRRLMETYIQSAQIELAQARQRSAALMRRLLGSKHPKEAYKSLECMANRQVEELKEEREFAQTGISVEALRRWENLVQSCYRSRISLECSEPGWFLPVMILL